MIEARRMEYDIGEDAYGRSSYLIAERGSNGAITWSIVSTPVHVRDDGERIASLTTSQLQRVAQSVLTATGGRIT